MWRIVNYCKSKGSKLTSLPSKFLGIEIKNSTGEAGKLGKILD